MCPHCIAGMAIGGVVSIKFIPITVTYLKAKFAKKEEKKDAP